MVASQSFAISLSLAVSAVSAASLGAIVEREAEKVVRELEGRSTANITSAALNAYDVYTEFAGAAYCGVTTAWDCGLPCSANSDFQVTAYGGDGNAIQMWYVGYSPSLDSVIVSHEGTNPTQFLSDLTDVEADFINLNATYFPNVDSDVMVHMGFADEQAMTAAYVLAAVQSTIASSGTTTVTTVGHSLGAALSMLDAVMLSVNLGSSITLNSVLYGCPRIGNPDYAALIDTILPGDALVRINHAYDPIPIVPGRSLGFLHPHGEIHILSTTDNIAITCSGDDDDTDGDCTDLYEDNNIFNGNILDHLGPYPGSPEIYLGTPYCSL